SQAFRDFFDASSGWLDTNTGEHLLNCPDSLSGWELTNVGRRSRHTCFAASGAFQQFAGAFFPGESAPQTFLPWGRERQRFNDGVVDSNVAEAKRACVSSPYVCRLERNSKRFGVLAERAFDRKPFEAQLLMLDRI